MNLHYSIQFYSYWHCGSGLSSGADADALVIKDKNGLPFVPGKTIKGLLREVVEEYSIFAESTIQKLFGTRVEDGESCDKQHMPGCAFFSNACLLPNVANIILSGNLQMYLYSKLTSTAIDEETGTAKDFSLRTIEVALPCTLYGEIVNVDEECAEVVGRALKMIKRLGLQRNRGLGRCDINIIKEGIA